MENFFGFIKKKLNKTNVKTFKEGDSVFLRVPDNLPKEIIHSFPPLLKKHKNIRLAYLAEGFLDVDEPVHYIIGIKTEGIETNQLGESMAKDVHELIPKNLYVDFIVLPNEVVSKLNTISHFMENNLIPFYTRD